MSLSVSSISAGGTNITLQCVGGQPCGKCVQQATECVFDESQDKRRVANLKRKAAEKDDERELLGRVFEAIKQSEEGELNKLISAIKESESPTDVRDVLDQQQGAPATDSSELDTDQSKSRTRRKVLDVHRLSDNPIFSLPARPWSQVTDDDQLVSHLISVYFTWHHIWFDWIDPEIFLEAMQSKKLDSQFCSPLLVNAMLAEACVSDNKQLHSIQRNFPPRNKMGA